MIIYRVEHERHRGGPYGADSPAYGFSHLWNGDDHPAPYEDGIEVEYKWSEYFFGFQSKQLMAKWFDYDSLAYFEKCGYKTYQYSVPPSKVVLGNKQCCFVREKWMERKEIEWRNFAVHLDGPKVIRDEFAESFWGTIFGAFKPLH